MKQIMSSASPVELLHNMDAIEYSWRDQEGVFHIDPIEGMYDMYYLQSPDEVQKSQKGICVDQVELERAWFEANNYEFETYCIEYYHGSYNPGHVFLIYRSVDKWVWFEHSWHDERGLKEFAEKVDLLASVKRKFIAQNDITGDEELHLFLYTQLTPHSNYRQMDRAMMPRDLYEKYRGTYNDAASERISVD